MGYYTVYKGSVTGKGVLLDAFCEAADREETFGTYGLLLSDWLDEYINGGESMKWYDWQSDCKELSAKYPNLLFTLNGEGEESGDIWRAYFRSGQVFVQQAQLVFPKVDLDSVLPVDVGSTKRVKTQRVDALRKTAMEAVEKAERAAEEARNKLAELG